MRAQSAAVIPAYNASATIASVLRGVMETGYVKIIVVIDDGSTDDTQSRAREHGAIVVRHDVNRGKGAALSTGFRWILEHTDVDSIVTLDADLQHDPNDLRKFFEKRTVSGANLTLGRRKRLGSGMPLSRILSNSITSFLVSARTGVHIPDSQCGYRLIGREVCESIALESSGFEAETELLIKAAARGFQIAWVPVRTIYHGETSHMTYWDTTKRFLHTLLKEH